MPQSRVVGSCHFIYQRVLGVESSVHRNKGDDSRQSKFHMVGVKRADIGNTGYWNDFSGLSAGRR